MPDDIAQKIIEDQKQMLSTISLLLAMQVFLVCGHWSEIIFLPVKLCGGHC